MARSSFPERNRQSGFTLVEVLIAMLVLTTGLIGLAQLLAVTTTMHSDAREATIATQLAQSKFDELMKLNLATNPAIQITAADTLAANTANYFDTPQAGVTRRWRVVAGPAANTRTVTIRVLDARARQYGRQMDFTTIIRQW
jgi:type IV pilus modification protein PilV